MVHPTYIYLYCVKFNFGFLLDRSSIMAANGAQGSYTPENVLAAVVTMRGGEREAKKQAHEYLERFQKSVGGHQDVEV